MLQAFQVSSAAAWLGTTGGRVDWWRFCIHLHTQILLLHSVKLR